MTATWNPAQYEKFKSQRSKPFFDLIRLIQDVEIGTAVDLGCGTGELTRALYDRFSIKHLFGLDSSPDMLAKSEGFATPGLRFGLGDIAEYQPEMPLDLLVSNAALQWVPDHASLFPKLLGFVKSGGQVAIQVPFNFDHPSHVVARIPRPGRGVRRSRSQTGSRRIARPARWPAPARVSGKPAETSRGRSWRQPHARGDRS